VNFVDECNINVEGGDGGAGCVSFRREAHVSRGGPDGGDGGTGGSIWLVADHNSASLLAFRDHPHRKAKSGKHGTSKKKHGTSAADIEVHVPEGTVIYDFDGNQLADLTRHGETPGSFRISVAPLLLPNKARWVKSVGFASNSSLWPM